MNTLSKILLITLMLVGTSSFAAKKKELLFTCVGYTDSNLESEDIRVVVYKNNSKYYVDMNYQNLKKTRIEVQPANNGPSLFASFVNEKEELQVDAFLDDVGSTSSLYYDGQDYSMTCENESL